MMTERKNKDVVLKYDLEAPPEKVWRAISLSSLRQQWLPSQVLAESAPMCSIPGKEIRYKMQDDEPPYLASIVTFQLMPNAQGGTTLTIIHRLEDDRLTPANDAQPRLMCAA
ncbi:SRPBCC family protein [Hafnia psychrotolerans]|uniref:Polyketide cyclase n=1 Tax=Hafnia psychrotolerans TaxID=1477018 RepID=A0ABQ1G1W3_9GAMM|nr:polyketide cyclase [Hafnia psychrotolerans]GGA35058.1 polyketide cyclase [Hafnia psychrotolerans]